MTAGSWRDAYSTEALARRTAIRATPEYRAAAATRSRAWYAENKERAKVTNKACYESNKEGYRKTQKAYYEANKDAEVTRRRFKRATDPLYAEKVRTWKRKRLPSPTRPCPPCCEICFGVSARGSLCLDHDHETGAFRGWLCDICNLALGQLGDNITGVRAALAYLEQSQ